MTDGGQVRGSIKGRRRNGVASWKGNPLAAPPVKQLRWRAPQPAAASTGVRDATAYAHDCVQAPFPSDAAPLGTTPAEDCLYANVWAPASAGAGAGAGANAKPQLTRVNADGMIGKYGIMDQIAAPKWVLRNDAAFGGYSNNVTIIGESAGGMSVHMLNTSPLARGLFSKAVVMSGGNGQSDRKTLADAEQVGAAFARPRNIDPAAFDALARLRALSPDEVTAGLNMAQLFRPAAGPPTSTGPFVDGKVVVDLGKAYSSGDVARVPMIVGATSPDIGGKSGFIITGARDAAATMVDKSVPVREYRFSHVANSVGHPGAQHATDIPFFFNTQAIKYRNETTPRDNQIGDPISDSPVNFANTGVPS